MPKIFFSPKPNQASLNRQLLQFWLLQTLTCLSLPIVGIGVHHGSEVLLALMKLSAVLLSFKQKLSKSLVLETGSAQVSKSYMENWSISTKKAVCRDLHSF